MGFACDYVCENCGYEAKSAGRGFDCAKNSRVTAYVLCPDHGVQWAKTGLNAEDEGWQRRRGDSYPCPECLQDRPLWDGETCPKCGQLKMVVDPAGWETCWD